MQEKKGDMWQIEADAYCITTNGIVKNDGCAVMGAGVALSAAKRYPDCPKELGYFIGKYGHRVGGFYYSIKDLVLLISFPTKDHWKDCSDIRLIEKSAKELMALVQEKGYEKVVLPRPGCANGGLNWEDVKKVIEPILDDRIVIVSL